MVMTPFEQFLALNMSPGEEFVEASFPVPADGHLVIEFITASLTVAIGQSPAVQFRLRTGGIPPPGLRHALVLFPQGTFGQEDLYAASQLVRLYPDQGSQVFFVFSRSDTSGFASGGITVTGFLSPKPVP
jgi:hypothetical protein